MERTMTQPNQPGATTRPAPTAPAGGFFSRPGFFGGLFAGFLGAGLFGMLMGHGLFGGLGGFASFLGLLLQIGIVALIAWFAWTWWQRRSQPAFAGGPSMRNDLSGAARPSYGLGGSGGGAPSGAPKDEIGLQQTDFEGFERLLAEIQTAYGAEDLSRLRAHVTPEMLSYYAEELAANSSRGEVNRITDVKLLQGDLSEAWREGDTEYATVAMRYTLNDQIIDRASGRLVEGGPDEATELWTFMRARGGQWILSAIQQV
jgi:predicted lipid-binding transport protein (Tim44 family)